MLSPIKIFTVIILAKLQIYIHIFGETPICKKSLIKYTLPHIINNTPQLVLKKSVTHSLHGFAYYSLSLYLLSLTKILKHMYNIMCQLFLQRKHFNIRIQPVYG